MQIILSGHFTELPSCINKELNISSANTIEIKDPTTEENRQTGLANNLESLKKYYSTVSHHPNFKNTLLLKKLNVKYSDAQILNDINWQVKRGEKWALLGDNGSGKSTLLGMIAADHPKVYANEVYLFDNRRGLQDSIWDIKKNIGFISSELHAYFNYDKDLSVSKIILGGLFTSIYNRPKVSQEQESCLSELCQYFKIEHLKNRTFTSLSTGEQRIVLILRAIIKNPPLLLLDEPFQGLDAITIERFKYLLNEVLTENHSLIFITHFKHEIPDCVDKVFLLEDGNRV